MLLTLGGDPRGLGRRVHLERLPAPSLLDAPPRLLGEDLRTGEDEARGDTQASGELLFCQQVRHRGVGNQNLGLEAVETLDDALQRVPRVYAQGGHPGATYRGADPRRLVPGVVELTTAILVRWVSPAPTPAQSKERL